MQGLDDQTIDLENCRRLDLDSFLSSMPGPVCSSYQPTDLVWLIRDLAELIYPTLIQGDTNDQAREAFALRCEELYWQEDTDLASTWMKHEGSLYARLVSTIKALAENRDGETAVMSEFVDDVYQSLSNDQEDQDNSTRNALLLMVLDALVRWHERT